MKRILRYFIIAALILLMGATSAINACADEYDAPSVTDEHNEDNPDATQDATDEYTEEEANATQDGAKGETDALDAEAETFFGRVYAELASYSGEIFSALTLIGSLTLAVAYKKKLLPLVESSLLSIGNAITKIKECSKESAECSTALSNRVEAGLLHADEVIDALVKRVDTLCGTIEASIKEEDTERRERRQLRLVMDAQVDMLYELFMSSSLPQYQKDAVGERIAKMKGVLAENEGEA